MKEILKSFIETSRDRIKNPFIGSFIISWMIINWRPIFILLFSNKEIEKKIEYIEGCYINYITYFLIPFLMTLIYMILLPYFMLMIDKIIRESTVGRKRNLLEQQMIDYEAKKKIAVEDSELEDIKANYRDKVDLNKQIEQLREQLNKREVNLKLQLSKIEELTTENTNLKKTIPNKNNIKKEKSNFEIDYDIFVKSDMYNFFKDIGSNIRRNEEFPNNISYLMKEKYLMDDIVKEINDDYRTYYSLTEKGLFFWKRYLKDIEMD